MYPNAHANAIDVCTGFEWVILEARQCTGGLTFIGFSVSLADLSINAFLQHIQKWDADN